MAEPTTALCECSNCGWVGSDPPEVRDFWSRVEPGGVMPAGDCVECGSLVFPQAPAPAPRPVKVYLNLNCGEAASDHVIAMHLDLGSLERIARIVRENQLDSATLRPPYELHSYDRYPAQPADGFLGVEAEMETQNCPLEEFSTSAEPTIRLGGFVLHVSGDGFCYGVGSAKHSDQSYSTEAFDLAAVAARLAGSPAAHATEAE